MTTKTYIVAYPDPSLHSRDRVCPCEVGSKTFAKGILDQLCDQYPDHTQDLKRATLWKAIDLKRADFETQPMQKVYDWIRDKDTEDRLHKGFPIAKSFPHGPHDESQELVDIVVVTPVVEESAQGDVLGELKYVRARREVHKGIERVLSPSDTVKSASAVKEGTIDPSGPRYGRPSHRFGPPTALFSEPLALLKYNLEHLESFTPDLATLNCALNLITSSTDFFPDEDQREEVLKVILGDLIPGRKLWQRPTTRKTAQPGGVWLEDFFAYIIVELKNEPGLAGDPFLQALIAYGKLIAEDEYAPYVDRSVLPAILLAIAGNRLVISTVVFTDATYADELLSVTLRLGPHGPDNVLRIARVFMAISESAKLLRELYKNILKDSVTAPAPPPTAKALWPNPTADPPDPTTPLPNLEFFCKVNRVDGTELFIIDEENKRHAMYLAHMKTETSTKVVLVKFAAKYNEDAHHLLASKNPPLAPALHYCTRVVGDMYMIVMDYIPKSEGQSLHSAPPLLSSALEVVQRGIDQALNLLHEKGLVFGDLREANVLYLPEGGGRVMLVDFDGVGLDGRDRYSASLNPEAGLGVDRWEIMRKAHDSENLRQLMGRLSRSNT